jgi:hypothetical protein
MTIALLLLACQNDYGVTQRPEAQDPPPNSDPVTESFVIDEAPADILFYADTSDSMRRHLEMLVDNIDVFTDRLDNLASDWQLLAVTSPTGCNNGGILTPDTADWQAAFSEGIQRKPTTNVEEDEMGLRNVANALAEANGGCNTGFLRDDVPVHVIFITDENDESPGWDVRPSDYWSDYVGDIIDAKGDANLVTLSVIGGDVPDGCGADDPSVPTAEPALGYADAVASTGGEFLSICYGWESDIDLLADSSVTRDTFVLLGDPDPDSIEVMVDGALVTNWAWLPPENAVFFVSDPPTGGQVVDITFVPASATAETSE